MAGTVFAEIVPTLDAFRQLVKTPLSARKKIAVILNAKKLFLLSPFARLFRRKRSRFLGFRIVSFSPRSTRLLFREIFVRNEYFFATNKKKPLILDCGANIGMATLYCKWLYPGAEIHSFEPDPMTFATLQENIKQNGMKDVHPVRAALSSRKGEIAFFVKKGSPGHFAMSTSSARGLSDELRVPAIVLSSYIKNTLKNRTIDFLKMDIEGSENDVVADLDQNGLLSRIKEGVIEYHHQMGKDDPARLGPFLQLLEKNGFSYQLDTVCVPTHAHGKFQDVLIHFYRR